MGATATRAVYFAKAQKGYKETGKNKTKYAKELDRVGYYKPQKKQGVAWCGTYCNWIIYETCSKNVSKAQSIQYQPHVNNLSASAKYYANYFRKKGRLYKGAKVGDIVFFGKAGKETHVGLVIAVKGSVIRTSEGNVKNKVVECNYKYNASKIVGYGRVKYDT